MERMGSRAFQLTYQRLEAPVAVAAGRKPLGTFYPPGTEPGDTARVAELEAEVKRLKAALAKRPGAPGFNSRPFTPAPKG